MAINPDNIDTVTVPQLDTASLALTNFFAHSAPSGKLNKATLSALATFIAPFVSSIGGSGYIEVTGNALPTSVLTSGFTLVGAGVYTQEGEGNLVLSGSINILSWNGTTWKIVKEIDFDFFTLFNPVQSINLFNEKNIIADQAINTSGDLVSFGNLQWYNSVPIPIPANTKFVFQSNASPTDVRIRFEDASHNKISFAQASELPFYGTTPAGTSFIVFPAKTPTQTLDDMSSIQLELGDVPHPVVAHDLVNVNQIDSFSLVKKPTINLLNPKNFINNTAVYSGDFHIDTLNGWVMTRVKVVGGVTYTLRADIDDNIRIRYEDEKFNLISGVQYSTSGPVTFTVPIGVSYVSFNIKTTSDKGADLLKAQLEFGSIAHNVEVFTDSYFDYPSKNLIQQEAILKNVAINNNPPLFDILNPYAGFDTAVVNVLPNTLYTYIGLTAPASARVRFEKSDGTFISGANFTGEIPFSFTTPSECGKVYIIVKEPNDPVICTETAMLVLGGDRNQKFSPFGFVLNPKFLPQSPYKKSINETFLQATKSVILGDSFVADEFRRPLWIYPFRDDLSLNLKCIGGSGFSVTNGASPVGCILNLLPSVYSENPGLVILEGGLNDAYLEYAANLGTFSNDEEADALPDTTYYGAYNAMIARIQGNCPQARIVVMVPVRRAKAQSGSEENQQKYADVPRYWAKRYGLPILDLHNSAWTYESLERATFATTVDGAHPSVFGGQILARLIASFLKTI